MDKEKISKETKDETPAPWENQSGHVYQKGNSEQVEKLIEENLRLTREIYKMTKKINRFVAWSRIFGVLKILIIVVPIILGIIYLPPLLGGIFEQYKDLLGGNPIQGLLQGGGNLNQNGVDLNQLSPELKKLIGK